MSTITAQRRSAEILYVEDEESFVYLTRRAFGMTGHKVNLHHVKNGEACMDFIRHCGEYVNSPTPDLILLDLSMPRMDGREVMETIYNDESLRHLVVIVLTSSDDEKDVRDMYRLRCSSYVVKPVNFDNFTVAIRSLCEFWLTVVQLPTV